MFALLYYAFCLSSYVKASQSCDTSVPGPLSVPIRNVTLPNSRSARGVALTVGSPPQNFALVPSAFGNNTYLYGVNGECAYPTDSSQCTTTNGGAFDQSASSSWISFPLSNSKTPDTYYNSTGEIFGTDTMHLNSSFSLKNFPLLIPGSHDTEFNDLQTSTFGLGRSSTILNELLNAGAIASRSWSLFWGLTGNDAGHQMDGTIVLGGYDVAKTTGQNYSTQFLEETNCESKMVITVTGLELVFLNGTTVNAIGSSQASSLQMCIKPEYEVLTLPDAVWEQFNLPFCGDRADGINLWGCDYPTGTLDNFDLRFTIENDFSVTIPNSNLVQRDISIDSSGNTIFDSTIEELMINPLESDNTNDIPLLGWPFMSSVYLSANYDQNAFYLWQANPTKNEKLVGFGTSGTGCTSNPSSASYPNAASAATSSTSTPKPPASNQSTSNLSAKSIASIVVAVVLVAIIATVAAIFCLRRRARGRHAKDQGETGMPPGYQNEPRDSAYGMANKAELMNTESPSMSGVQVGSSSTPTHSPPQELSAEMPVRR